MLGMEEKGKSMENELNDFYEDRKIGLSLNPFPLSHEVSFKELKSLLIPYISHRIADKESIEQEKKIDTSYQGIYDQFLEIMKSLQVSVVPTIGKPFDPKLAQGDQSGPRVLSGADACSAVDWALGLVGVDVVGPDGSIWVAPDAAGPVGFRLATLVVH
ncbi:hypothetical protein M9H77_12897 [Catharanthus roseus]|uniref:Uncharacterized protein n=1 Tax=Catharanthus roseus TaxID=4058 RepID=A0ACC0BIX3_CATRO|nr:hypothetical protein M9H77_12897 [Catharanthus roseus]